MNCKNPVRIVKNLNGSEYPDGLLVPCGKCYYCKKQKAKEWSVRMLHELENHEKSSFITLTYDENHIPPYNSLVKSDLQKFFKRLRKKIEMDNQIHNENRKIKYFACGEYGDQTSRPHYHSILFGVSLENYDKMLVENAWSLNGEQIGMVHFGLAEPKSIKYVAQYINKKFDGDLAYEEYYSNNRENQFKISSNGLGSAYVDKYSHRICQNKMLTINGVKTGIPRYYIKKLDIDKDEMKKFALEEEQKLNMKLAKVQGTYPEYITSNYSPENVSLLLKENRKKRNQVDKNIKAKISLSKGKL